jgi:hypothetical protein
MKGW